MFQPLQWFRVTFGLHFNMDHWLTQPFRLLPPDHRVPLRAELQPWELVNLLLMMKMASGTKLLVLAFLVWAAISCVRFEHIQRSRYLDSHPQCLIFECSQGQARGGGRSAPVLLHGPCLNWSFSGSVCTALCGTLSLELNPQLSFLWPALQVSSEDLWEVTEGTAWLMTRKMSRGRFLVLLRGALITTHGDHDQARGAGYNRLRRFLPTMGGPQVLHSAAVKRALIQRFLLLLRRTLPELALNADGLVARDAWTWPELAQMNESLGPLEAALATPDAPPAPEAPPMDTSGVCVWQAQPRRLRQRRWTTLHRRWWRTTRRPSPCLRPLHPHPPPIVLLWAVIWRPKRQRLPRPNGSYRAAGYILSVVLWMNANCPTAGTRPLRKIRRARERASAWWSGANFASAAWHACRGASASLANQCGWLH